MRVFLEDPAVPMDTNHLEREIRPIAVGRKNWLFCWKEAGARQLSVLYRLISTCRLKGIGPYPYMAITGNFARMLNRPVQTRITREQEFYIGSARSGMQGWIKVGVKADGKVSAVDLVIVFAHGEADHLVAKYRQPICLVGHKHPAGGQQRRFPDHALRLGALRLYPDEIEARVPSQRFNQRGTAVISLDDHQIGFVL